ncbi:LysM peptidoglycan-binding domain-containing protein [Sporomusa sphaeroides DSM 2875]|uniref:LysM peptidoglycan-binding domain-containing protein n=1 Tax=Sporomusa sphaeroides TaxID=47679 RepID=UPI00202DD637|nr:LysM peptidoglycan-binding domain-containing protein [Sporomusa sphaeroides]MCM0758066.1 LysM peptidoglycan-binding domain-containing protein [Sporomusa sphaeroides DSM 2875]
MNPKALLAAVIIVLAVTSCGNTEPRGQMISEVYVVKSGDTLWQISEQYMAKNTGGPRDIREFYHGIIEVNSDSALKDRVPGDIRPGDKLVINYFVK